MNWWSKPFIFNPLSDTLYTYKGRYNLMTIILTHKKTGLRTTIQDVHAVWTGVSKTKLGFKVPALKYAVSKMADPWWDEKVISLKDHDYKVIN